MGAGRLKFLTVLLVIAVMFTFSFGSAFAAAPAPADQVTPEKVVKEINDAADALIAQVQKAKNDALFTIFGSAADKTIGGVTVSKASVEKIYNDVLFDAAVEAIEAARATKLQAVQTAMNPTGKTFSGYFTTAGTEATDTVNGIVYSYPTYDKNYAAVECDYKATPGASATTITVSTIAATTFTALFKVTADPAFDGTYKDNVGRQAFKDVKEATLAAISAIDLSVYSKEYKNTAKSNYDLATELVAKAIAEINGITVASDATWADVTTATTGKIALVEAVYKAGSNQADPSGKLAVGGLLAAPYDNVGLNNLEKIADEPTAEAKLEWAKAKVLGVLNTAIETRLNTTTVAQDNIILEETLKGSKANASIIAAAKDAKDQAQKEAAAAKEIVAYLVDDCDKLADLITVPGGTAFTSGTILADDGVATVVGATWRYNQVNGGLKAPGLAAPGYYMPATQIAIVEHVAELKEEAEILKSSVMIDGAEYVAIEDALEEAIDDCYKKGITNNTLAQADTQKALWDRQDALTGRNSEATVKINGRKYTTVDNWYTTALNNVALTTYNNGVYDQQFYDELRDVVYDTKVAINKTKTIEEAEAAYLAGLAKFEEIKSLADKNAAQATKEFRDLKAKYTGEIAAYVEYKKDTLVAANASTSYSWNPGADVSEGMKKNLVDTFDDAYSVEELTAAFEAAKAEVDNLKTKADLAAAKKDLDERIKAYTTNTTVTVADKEVVGTLLNDIEDHNDYCDLIGNTANKVIVVGGVEAAYEKIRQLEEDALEAEIKAIGKVTLDDEDAIDALSDAIDAYVEYYAGEDAEDKLIDALYYGGVVNGKTYNGVVYNGIDIDDLYDDLEALKIAKFRTMVGQLPADASDVEGIKAAREAYEALWRGDRIALYRTAAYDKLLDLEKILATSVKTLKITASSTAKKGSITVKWTVDGNAAAADGFQVWKSTKHSSGYKKMFTTTKTSYKNTKGLKKGTRYYYKVRAYKVVDGKTIYSDWSNKARRIAK